MAKLTATPGISWTGISVGARKTRDDERERERVVVSERLKCTQSVNKM